MPAILLSVLRFYATRLRLFSFPGMASMHVLACRSCRFRLGIGAGGLAGSGDRDRNDIAKLSTGVDLDRRKTIGVKSEGRVKLIFQTPGEPATAPAYSGVIWRSLAVTMKFPPAV